MLLEKNQMLCCLIDYKALPYLFNSSQRERSPVQSKGKAHGSAVCKLARTTTSNSLKMCKKQAQKSTQKSSQGARPVHEPATTFETGASSG